MKFCKPRLLVKAVLQYCLVALLGFSFISLQSKSLAAEGLNLSGKNCAALSSVVSFKSVAFPFSGPFKTGSLPGNLETPDENETDDNSDFELVKLVVNSFFEIRNNLNLEVFSFAPFTSSFYTRAAVSLFILHHSWKTFLV